MALFAQVLPRYPQVIFAVASYAALSASNGSLCASVAALSASYSHTATPQ